MNRRVTLATLAGLLVALSGCVAEEGYYDQGYGYRGAPQAYRGPNYYAPAPFWGPAWGPSYRGDGYRGDGYRGDERHGPAFREQQPSRGAERGGSGHDPGRNAQPQQQQRPQPSGAAPQGQRGGGPMGPREQNRKEQGAN